MNDNLFSIRDKVIIITGGGGGQGSVISYEMAKRGAKVYSLDLKFSEKVPQSLKKNLFQNRLNLISVSLAQNNFCMAPEIVTFNFKNNFLLTLLSSECFINFCI